jgi:hypothetical protein
MHNPNDHKVTNRILFADFGFESGVLEDEELFDMCPRFETGEKILSKESESESEFEGSSCLLLCCFRACMG